MAVKKLETDRATYISDFIESDTERAVFLGNPLLDNMMSSLLALGTEVWSTRRRLNVVEALLAEKGVTEKMIEEYVPSEEQAAKWEKDRDTFIDLAYSPLLREGDIPVATPYAKDDE
jgi:hypothetical protein